MLSRRGKTCWFLVVLATGIVGAQQGTPDFAPRPGVLVLRGNRVLQGDLLRVADRYVVKIGNGSEINVPVERVRFRCGSLREAYECLAAKLGPNAKAADHLQLGDWCLRYGLLADAAEQLMAAMNLDRDSPAVARFETRLRIAAHRPVARRTPQSTPPPSSVSPAVLDRTIRQLPPETVEQFTRVVQPLLLNRCATAGCHGPRHNGAFRLLRPSRTQQITRRFTQQNLYRALQLLDREQPTQSPLLVRATDAHARKAAAGFGQTDVSQLAKLAAWVHRAAQGNNPVKPAAITNRSPLLLQPIQSAGNDWSAPRSANGTDPSAMPPSSAVVGSVPNRRSSPTPTVTSHSNSPTVVSAMSDPFDPAEFNHRYVHRDLQEKGRGQSSTRVETR